MVFTPEMSSWALGPSFQPGPIELSVGFACACVNCCALFEPRPVNQAVDICARVLVVHVHVYASLRNVQVYAAGLPRQSTSLLYRP